MVNGLKHGVKCSDALTRMATTSTAKQSSAAQRGRFWRSNGEFALLALQSESDSLDPNRLFHTMLSRHLFHTMICRRLPPAQGFVTCVLYPHIPILPIRRCRCRYLLSATPLAASHRRRAGPASRRGCTLPLSMQGLPQEDTAGGVREAFHYPDGRQQDWPPTPRARQPRADANAGEHRRALPGVDTPPSTPPVGTPYRYSPSVPPADASIGGSSSPEPARAARRPGHRYGHRTGAETSSLL